MKTIIAIVGKSGSGKDTAATYLEKRFAFRRIASYTTRPMRSDEVDGKEHIFVDKFDRMINCFAYAQYGDYEYWTTWSQFSDYVPNVYIVDEASLEAMEQRRQQAETFYRFMKENNPTPLTVDLADKLRFNLIKVTIIRDRITGVPIERIKRDKDRPTLPNDFYDHVIVNVSMTGFESQLNRLARTIINNSK